MPDLKFRENLSFVFGELPTDKTKDTKSTTISAFAWADRKKRLHEAFISKGFLFYPITFPMILFFNHGEIDT